MLSGLESVIYAQINFETPSKHMQTDATESISLFDNTIPNRFHKMLPLYLKQSQVFLATVVKSWSVNLKDALYEKYQCTINLICQAPIISAQFDI